MASPTSAPTFAASLNTSTNLTPPPGMLTENQIVSMLPPPHQHRTFLPRPFKYPNTLCLLIHKQTWDRQGRVAVLSMRYGVPVIEAFQFQDPAQTWALFENGAIRSLAGPGLYLSVPGECNTVIASPQLTRSAQWEFDYSGSAVSMNILDNVTITSTKCNKKLSAGRDGVTLYAPHPAAMEMGPHTMSQWIILPIGQSGTFLNDY